MSRRILSIIGLVLTLALVAAACGDDDDDAADTPETVLQLAVEAGQFSTLVAAIEAAGLADTLEGEGPFTVFAPTNAAFDGLLETLGITADELLENPSLADILTYHVLPQEADSQLVATLDGESVETVNGATVDISVVSGDVMVNDATVVSADLEADNGIVHVIDEVLLPPDVAEALGVGAAGDEEPTDMPEEEPTATPEEERDRDARARADDPADRRGWR